jgi:tetraacyldisaccharide 4'-kinase
MKKISRYLLFPVSLIYGGIILLRNYFYDKNILRSACFDFPLICVGNLAVGGTGKSPMVEYLAGILKDQFKVATLSRGYGRKTKGFLIADKNGSARSLGDEPSQFYSKFDNITVAVAEDRVLAIPQLLVERPEIGVILLDDAFQHREVRAGLNILLTEYDHLYSADCLLPFGTLRDTRQSSKRADIIVVTKCPENMVPREQSRIIASLEPLSHQQVFFTSLAYDTPYHIITGEKRELTKGDDAHIICGIANPKPLVKYVSSKVKSVGVKAYRDHYDFSAGDVTEMIRMANPESPERSVILTTEKDAMRLRAFAPVLTNIPVYAIPVRHIFLFNGEEPFKKKIISFVIKF